MLFAQSAQLIYDGAGMHEIKNLTALQQDGKVLNETDNRALAEYIMRKIDYANNFYSNTRMMIGNKTLNASRKTSRQINHIHHSCQREIESKWQPPITDEEAFKLMFQEEIESKLPNVTKNQTIEIDL